MVIEYSKRVFEIILQCGLEGLRIEDSQIDQDIYSPLYKIFISVPATSTIDTLAGEALGKKFKQLYIEAFKEEVEKDLGISLIDQDWSKYVTIYCKIRDEEWTEEKRNDVMDRLNQLKQLSSDYQVI